MKRELTGVLNLMYNVCMTKHRHKTHNYREGEIVFKRWFRTDLLLNKLNALTDAEKRQKLCNNLSIGPSRIIAMSKPDFVISWSTADKYATKLRLSSLYDMA
jgi:hypothetical protein